MPPRAKFSREEIVEAALQLTRESGPGAVTARDIAARLNVSTRPIFTYFKTMDELKGAARAAAESLYRERIERGLRAKIPFLGVEMEYLRFACDEPQLYRLLFLTRPEDGNAGAMAAMRRTQAQVCESLMKTYQIQAGEADWYFRNMWLAAHSLATLAVTVGPVCDMDEMRTILTEFSLSLLKAIKTIPGIAAGDIDRKAAFEDILGAAEKG